MAEIPMVAFWQTDFGDFRLSQAVADKLDTYPKIKVTNPFTNEVSELDVIDCNDPVIARYSRWVERHMHRQWVKKAGASEETPAP